MMMAADEALKAQRERDREWSQTEIGRLFYAYEAATDTARAADAAAVHINSYNADQRAMDARKKQREARAAFLTALRGFA